MRKFQKVPLLCFSLLYVTGLMFYLMATIEYVSPPPVVGIVGVGSISASLFILMVRPDREVASFQNIIVGYATSIIIGLIFHKVLNIQGETVLDLSQGLAYEFTAALGVLAVVIAFIRLEIDHPPAIGITLAVSIGYWNFASLAILISAIFWLIVFRCILVHFGASNAYWWREDGKLH